jgi:hypothetical protein
MGLFTACGPEREFRTRCVDRMAIQPREARKETLVD